MSAAKITSRSSPGGFGEDKLPELIQRPVPVRYAVLHRLVHLRVRLLETVGLEHGIPSKVRRPPRRHDRPVGCAHENLRLAFRSVDVREDALRVRALVRVPRQHLVQALVPELIQEPLDVRSGQAVEGVVAEARVLDERRAVDLPGGEHDLLLGDVLGFALKLGEVHLARLERELIRVLLAEDGADLLQLVLIASHECDRHRGLLGHRARSRGCGVDCGGERSAPSRVGGGDRVAGECASRGCGSGRGACG
mmetsp:Transcript_6339/g.27919  ORF Transcript_6339/g.27919 Transcript_6339/m.27919 type:complete len:251 (-) Transcript_6339:25-777(-)